MLLKTPIPSCPPPQPGLFFPSPQHSRLEGSRGRMGPASLARQEARVSRRVNPQPSHSICSLGGAITACWGQINAFNRHVYLTGFAVPRGREWIITQSCSAVEGKWKGRGTEGLDSPAADGRDIPDYIQSKHIPDNRTKTGDRFADQSWVFTYTVFLRHCVVGIHQRRLTTWTWAEANRKSLSVFIKYSGSQQHSAFLRVSF